MKYIILKKGFKKLLIATLLFSSTACIKKQSIKSVDQHIPSSWENPPYNEVQSGWVFIKNGEISRFNSVCISEQDAKIVIENQNICETTRKQILRHLKSLNSPQGE